MIDQKEIDYLLVRLILDEIEDDEREQVMDWLAADERNRIYYRELQSAHLKMQWGMQSVSVSGRYAQFNRNMIRRRWLKTLYWGAACFVFLIGIGCGYWIFNQEKDAGMYAEQPEMIQPGKPQAILYMASGKAIRMNHLSAELKEQDGTRLKISNEGELIYQTGTRDEQVVSLYNRIVVPRGGEFTVTLADGTRVWLNANSELYYPARFTGGTREVFLTGEAYFDVEKVEDIPFVVRVNDLSVKVYGTQFNVNSQVEGVVKTVLVEGTVGITGGGQEVLLKPNQMAEFLEDNGDIKISDVDVLPYVAWRDGNFIFRNESLGSIMDKLALWYDLDVIYVNDELRHIYLSGNLLRYKDVNELFYSFEKISEARFQVKGKTVMVSY